MYPTYAFLISLSHHLGDDEWCRMWFHAQWSSSATLLWCVNTEQISWRGDGRKLQGCSGGVEDGWAFSSNTRWSTYQHHQTEVSTGRSTRGRQNSIWETHEGILFMNHDHGRICIAFTFPNTQDNIVVHTWRCCLVESSLYIYLITRRQSSWSDPWKFGANRRCPCTGLRRCAATTPGGWWRGKQRLWKNIGGHHKLFFRLCTIWPHLWICVQTTDKWSRRPRSKSKPWAKNVRRWNQ